MARVGRYSRRRASRSDSGAAWISYSDMMAALLLVFVLVLCYSIYQYFTMLETKTAELDEKSALLTTQEEQLAQQQSTLTEQQDQLIAQQAALLTKQTELDSALTSIEEQKGLLDTQNMTLEEQKTIIATAQAALLSKEEALTLAQQELADNQTKLDAASLLLTKQQEAMDQQQVKLDNLVGVRTQIIQALSDALTAANLSARVDPNTGDIALSSNVFFDVSKFNIRPEGLKQLDSFIPVYLSVLLKPEYRDYLGEIVIEGHTDSQGTYITNLKLSQERALSVATYCLQMPQLSEQQRELLRSILTAKGRSSSDLVMVNGVEDMDASRRVEFKFRLKDSEMIDEIRDILTK